MSHRPVLELFVRFRLNLALVQLRNSCYKNPLYSHLSDAVAQAEAKAIIRPSSRTVGGSLQSWGSTETPNTQDRDHTHLLLLPKKDSLMAMMMQVHRTRMFIMAMS